MASMDSGNQITLTSRAPSTRSDLKLVRSFIRGKSRAIKASVSEYPEFWHVEDKLLCWIIPAFTAYAEEYYNRNGPQLCEILSPLRLGELDKYLTYILHRRLFSDHFDPPIDANVSEINILLDNIIRDFESHITKETEPHISPATISCGLTENNDGNV